MGGRRQRRGAARALGRGPRGRRVAPALRGRARPPDAARRPALATAARARRHAAAGDRRRPRGLLDRARRPRDGAGGRRPRARGPRQGARRRPRPRRALARPIAVSAGRSIRVRGEADVAEATRAARDLALASGLGRTEAVQLATAVSEIAGNQIRHARGGTVTLAASPRGVTIVAADDGPGIADVGLALTDGWSTA